MYGTDVGDGGITTKVGPPSTDYYAANTDCTFTPDGGLQQTVTFPSRTFADAQCEPKSPLQGRLVEVDAPSFGISSQSIQINGDPLGETMIHVKVTSAVMENTPVDDDSAADSTTIKFLGPPVKAVRDRKADDSSTPVNEGDDAIEMGMCRADEDDPAADDPRSDLAAMDGNKLIGSGDVARTETINATVVDEYCRPLAGTITYTVEFKEGSSLLPGRDATYSTQPMKYEDEDGDFYMTGNDSTAVLDPVDPVNDSGRDLAITGWQDNGPVSVNVTARFSGGTGDITLGPLTLTRSGALDAVQADTCVPDSDDDDDKDLCGEDSRSRSVFPPGTSFMITDKVVDALGTTISGVPAVTTLPSAKTEKGDNVIAVATMDAEVKSAMGLKDSDDDPADIDGWYTIHKDTPPDMYDVVVKASHIYDGEKVSQENTLTITVGGDPETYAVSGPENVPLTSFASAEYTVKATDASGNTDGLRQPRMTWSLWLIQPSTAIG